MSETVEITLSFKAKVPVKYAEVLQILMQQEEMQEAADNLVQQIRAGALACGMEVDDFIAMALAEEAKSRAA